MGIGINIAGTGIGLTQTIMNQKNKQTGQYDEVSGRVTHCTLHWFDDTQGNEAVMSTSLAGGGSLTVYKPADFNPKDPKYLVKTWDSDGNVTEEEVSLNKVDPSNATYVQMAAYSAYAAKQKLVQNADGLFLAATEKLCFGMDNLHDKMDFTQIVKSTAQEQLEAKNWHGYMQMNSLADFLEKTHDKVKNQPDSQTEDVTTTERTKETAVHTPFDKFDGKKHAPYYELADENGIIEYKGTVFVCDDEHGALCLGDMSDESNVLSIPLAGGGTLKVNRNNKADLARAIGMFKPEDVRRIMVALAQDNKVQEMENEIEDEKNSIGTGQENQRKQE